MTPEHLTTPVSAIGTITSATRRSVRTRGGPQTTPMEYAIREREAEEAKKKKRRDSNVRRGEDAVKIRLESEEKAKKSGEIVKTCKN